MQPLPPASVTAFNRAYQACASIMMSSEALPLGRLTQQLPSGVGIAVPAATPRMLQVSRATYGGHGALDAHEAAMTKFYFDISEHSGALTLDTNGIVLASEDVALWEGGEALIDIAKDYLREHAEFRIGVVVRDENGDEVGRRFIRFSASET